jgi:hypothetical protein
MKYFIALRNRIKTSKNPDENPDLPVDVCDCKRKP